MMTMMAANGAVAASLPSPSSSSSTTLSGRTVSRGCEEAEEDEIQVGKKETAPGRGGGTIAGDPQHHQQQQQQSPGKPSLLSSSRRRRQREGHFTEAATTTRLRQRRSTSFFILLLSSALTLALSSLYFSTTLTARRSNEEQQQQPEITAPNVPSATKPKVQHVQVAAAESESNKKKKNTRDMKTKAAKSSQTIIATNVVSRAVETTLLLPRNQHQPPPPPPVIDDNNSGQEQQQQQTKPDLSSLPHRNNHHRPTDSSAANDAAATTRAEGSDNVVLVDKNKHHRLEHPYWGARDENGHSGHVHDPTVHRRPFTISNPERLAGLCDAPGKKRKNGGNSTSIEGGEMGARALQKVQISSSVSSLSVSLPSSDYDKKSLANNDNNNKNINNNKNDTNPIRLFCALYTHTGAIEQTNALLETWAPRCDGLLLASNATNATTHHVHIPHKSVAEGKYKGIWQRVRAMMAYLYQNFLNDYDYFHFCGDDTFVLVENLKAFLSSAQVANATNHGERPLFAGYWAHLKFWGDEYPEDFYFLSGGPGYTLSRSALKAFVEQALPTCRANKDDPFEDLNVAWCFYHMLNISGIDTRDETGAQRYHPMSAEMHAKFPAQKVFGAPSFMVRKTKEHMEKEFGFPTLYGLDDISSSSVAFHYLKNPLEIKRYEMLLYGTGREQCHNSDSTSAMAVA